MQYEYIFGSVGVTVYPLRNPDHGDGLRPGGFRAPPHGRPYEQVEPGGWDPLRCYKLDAQAIEQSNADRRAPLVKV
jgi:hypothetical protein